MSAGLFGLLISARHIRRVSAPHDAFDRAFGRDWEAGVPSALQARMLGARWSTNLPQPPDVPWQRDVVFGAWPETGEPLLCDIWQPPAGVSRSGLGIIYLHGSGWHYLDKDAGTRPFFRHLAGQGHVIVDVAYTLAPKAQLHGMLGEVKRAIAWLKTRAADYGVRPDRIVLMGGSAGGHLALLAGYTPNHPEFQPAGLDSDTSVRAVVSYYGPPDLLAMYRYIESLSVGLLGADSPVNRVLLKAMTGMLQFLFPSSRIRPPYGKIVISTEMISGLLGGTPDDAPHLYTIGSPMHYVGPHCPPTLLLQGGHDIGVKPGAPAASRAVRSGRHRGLRGIPRHRPRLRSGLAAPQPGGAGGDARRRAVPGADDVKWLIAE
jgi:acetyl esterase/lipase